MKRDTEAVLDIAAILMEAAAMNDAALGVDFDEARFRADRIATMADALGLDRVSMAAVHMTNTLGPVGSSPKTGYGACMVALAVELEAVPLG